MHIRNSLASLQIWPLPPAAVQLPLFFYLLSISHCPSSNQMKDVDSMAMPEGSTLYDLVQAGLNYTHASVGVLIHLRKELSLPMLQYNNWFTFSEYEEPVTVCSTRPIHANELATYLHLARATLVGFMAGAAIIVSLQQLKGLLGIVHFTNKMQIVPVLVSVFQRTDEWSWQTIVMGASFMLLLLTARKVDYGFWIPWYKWHRWNE